MDVLQATKQAAGFDDPIPQVTIDGNEAAGNVAYLLSEVIAIYPITPSTPMGEAADAFAATGKPNLWGTVPTVYEMQSEGGAAGAIHGAIQTGALTTTFTASQGLLLMIPNMFKIAGELTPTVFHVAARSIAAQGLSIFGDHSDVMATRATGWALLSSGSVQEAQDLALIAHAATLQAWVPCIHFFDGFRTSHEVNKITPVSEAIIRAMIDDELVRAHRARALSPERPVLRGTAQNPDVYFQARESVNPFYNACPEIFQQAMDRFAALTGRAYQLFDYSGPSDAERVVVVMGSAGETVEETARYLAAHGEKVGVLRVRLYRPFAPERLIAALPKTTKALAVLDRCKEPGSSGEPMLLDVITAVYEFGAEHFANGKLPTVIGGRYGLSSKEFTPGMVKAVFDELKLPKPRSRFTVGITDDVSMTSLEYDRSFDVEPAATVRCIFWGLGADGTVGANKNSIKIIGEETPNDAQGYFVYDSKKSGSVTISHLRFGPEPIRAPYLIGDGQAQFVACHQFNFLERLEVLRYAAPGATFLLNSPYGPDEVWNHLTAEVQQTIRAKGLRLWVIDAATVAHATGMRGRVNTVMQTCFFAISGIMPRDEAIAQIKRSIKKTYGKRGDAVIKQNFMAVDQTLDNLYEVGIPAEAPTTNELHMQPSVSADAPPFVRDVLAKMIALRGDDLPVSVMPCDGTFPTGTTKYEKRNIALEVPVWEPDICIQCNKCAFVCPHAVIRPKVYAPEALEAAPASFKSAAARFKEFPGQKFTIQVSVEDCTGCALCVEACPVKDKRQTGRKAINMAPQAPLRQNEVANWDFFLSLPDVDRTQLQVSTVKNSQLLLPLFEFSGACAGCGETPYIKLVSQLFGDRSVIANATGCSSIYGGNLPTTPWAFNHEGRGPAWSNSLFEDNAEFGLGMRLTIDKQQEYAYELIQRMAAHLNAELVQDLLHAEQRDEAGISAQRARVATLKQHLTKLLEGDVGADVGPLRDLLSLADLFVRRTVWILGGDGWAYDIGYGGLDHVLASGRNVNILVLDTEVYSNTGGQASKSTPLAAVAKFAAKGKATAKKDLGLIAMAYGNVYVARIAMGYDALQTLRAIQEAEAYDGPSIVIAYSHCIAHGIDMRRGLKQQKLAVESGMWVLYRFNPDLIAQGQNPLHIDSKEPSIPPEQYAAGEGRFQMLVRTDAQRADALLAEAKRNNAEHYHRLAQMMKD
ncbi:pyruvate:ferredoxin (flavodoxin) oxidoreductase [Candidatus Viridilinea mediisalina]|uniref:Pyruvate:ferredoxin (Flavodoxin) oxidoreductase n=1 Tax=Candidatus Viridilinea mediisalina TaxID=2024553 RepID=A0A2A6RMS2_9CHLR|nr:pyruvate:ferredoxin (flavodoxin) oxidoreductase [Candidatus Viridilinea mediisalina]PDW04159.1 pyruvate:ferredoxin (flavodoxin) oxidoreductase [Candidatus Viridilinea mediisalina]